MTAKYDRISRFICEHCTESGRERRNPTGARACYDCHSSSEYSCERLPRWRKRLLRLISDSESVDEKRKRRTINRMVAVLKERRKNMNSESYDERLKRHALNSPGWRKALAKHTLGDIL